MKRLLRSLAECAQRDDGKKCRGEGQDAISCISAMPCLIQNKNKKPGSLAGLFGLRPDGPGGDLKL
ncbi:hypothetical protein [Roseibium litorale]|uniref:Uncharacterized protein n=1 Tax=Roseibium litorale TaxID=2803841 RepID=A0ABR9CKH0_9HYPH|nr:hypothetical protein [Roseibium litorale]MBD8891323.1 hypothetical protein [Roseibium litorale]